MADAKTADQAVDVIGAVAGPYAWIGKVAREWGIFAAMCVFFIYQSSVREGALNKQLDKQIAFSQDKLVTLVENNTAALQAFKSTLEQKQK